jgi:hypothetical protein
VFALNKEGEKKDPISIFFHCTLLFMTITTTTATISICHLEREVQRKEKKRGEGGGRVWQVTNHAYSIRPFFPFVLFTHWRSLFMWRANSCMSLEKQVPIVSIDWANHLITTKKNSKTVENPKKRRASPRES